MSEFKLQIKITYSYFLVCIVHYEDRSFFNHNQKPLRGVFNREIICLSYEQLGVWETLSKKTKHIKHLLSVLSGKVITIVLTTTAPSQQPPAIFYLLESATKRLLRRFTKTTVPFLYTDVLSIWLIWTAQYLYIYEYQNSVGFHHKMKLLITVSTVVFYLHESHAVRRE